MAMASAVRCLMAFAILSPLCIEGQLLVTQAGRDQLQTRLNDVVRGVNGATVQVSGSQESFGTFSGGNFGIFSGFVLSTGRVDSIANVNHRDSPLDDLGANFAAGDEASIGASFTGPAEVEVCYVFASRELPEFGGSATNDNFAIILNDRIISVLEDGQTPVEINSLVPKGTKVGRDVSEDDKNYVDNLDKQFFMFSGYTLPLSAKGSAQSGTNTLNISVSDDADGELDPAVFVGQCTGGGGGGAAAPVQVPSSPAAVPAPAPGFSLVRFGGWGPCNCATKTQMENVECRTPQNTVAPSLSMCPGTPLTRSCNCNEGEMQKCPLFPTKQSGPVVRTARAETLLQRFASEVIAEKGNIFKDVRVIGNANGFGVFESVPGSNCFGIQSGIIISTGYACYAGAPTFDVDAGVSYVYTREGHDFGRAGVLDDNMQFIMKFDFDREDLLTFRFIFASQELPSYGGSQYNDRFVMTVNGEEVAKLEACYDLSSEEDMPPPKECKDVTINNLCDETCKDSRGTVPSDYNYVNNPALKCFPYSGYTRVIQVAGLTKIGQNEINITVYDVSDGILDSVVILDDASLSIGPQYRAVGPFSECVYPPRPDGRECDGTQTRAFRCVGANFAPLPQEQCETMRGPAPEPEERPCGFTCNQPRPITRIPTSEPTFPKVTEKTLPPTDVPTQAVQQKCLIEMTNPETVLATFLAPSSNLASLNYSQILPTEPRKYGIFTSCGCGMPTAGFMLTTGLVTDARYKELDASKAKYGYDYFPEGIDGDRAEYILAFDLYESTSTLSFDYLFASMELREWGGSAYNDIFQMTLNGEQIAKLSDGKLVTINNLVPDHKDKSRDHPDYTDNPGSTCFVYTGYTRTLTASAKTKAGRNYLNISIVDVSDGKYDSAVFLGKESFKLDRFSWQLIATGTCSQTCATAESPGQVMASYKCVNPVGTVAPERAGQANPCESNQGPAPGGTQMIACTNVPLCGLPDPTYTPSTPTPKIVIEETPAPIIRTDAPFDVYVPEPTDAPATATTLAPQFIGSTGRGIASVEMCCCQKQEVWKPIDDVTGCMLYTDLQSGKQCYYPTMYTFAKCIFDYLYDGEETSCPYTRNGVQFDGRTRWPAPTGTTKCRGSKHNVTLAAGSSQAVTYSGPNTTLAARYPELTDIIDAIIPPGDPLSAAGAVAPSVLSLVLLVAAGLMWS